MKNITVTVDEDLYHRARVKAAEKRRSLSALVKEFLATLVEEESEFERLRRLQNETIARVRAARPGFSASDRLSREEVHERRAVR